ncbi:LOW QUALITY PROTEIN: leucine-rich repeat-containing protein 14-like [Trichechus inunguis]
MNSHTHTLFLATAFLIFLGWQHRLGGSLVTASVFRRKHLLQAHGLECLETLPVPFLFTNMMENLQADECTPNVQDSPGVTEPGEIHADLYLYAFLSFFYFSRFTSYILQTAKNSHGCLRLCCQTLVITQVPSCNYLGTQGLLKMEIIQQLRLQDRHLDSCKPYLTNFITLAEWSFLGYHIMHDFPCDLAADYLSLLSSLGHLKKLHLISGCLSWKHHKWLSCLQKPVKSLVISECRLTRNDIADMSMSIHAICLKELALSNNNLSQMVPGPPEFLLGEVSGTLQHLNLRNCGLEESQLRTLLPTLCGCSHHCSRVLGDSVFSTSDLMCVLQLAGLKVLKRVQYPIPTECVVYLDDSRSGNLNRVELARVHATLQGMLQALQWEDMELTNSTSTD